VALEGRIYVFVFWVPTITQVCRRDFAYVLDPGAGVWAPIPAPAVGRHALGVAASGGRVLAIGGLGTVCSLGPIIVAPDVEGYDPATMVWTRMPDLPLESTISSAVSIDDHVYAFGGGAFSLQGNVFQFNPQSQAWTRDVRIPVEVSWPAAVVWEGQILAFAGVNTADVQEVWRLDPRMGVWTPRTAMPIAGTVSVAAAGGKVFVFGPFATWEYAPDRDLR